MNRITANKGVNAMQLALRPYVTTGIAIVGATVIAAAPMSRYADLDGHTDPQPGWRRSTGRWS